MLVIRLSRVGKRNAASFRVVLAEKSRPVKGKFIEILGFFNPRTKEKSFKGERIKHWLSQGAQASPTVHNLLVEEKIIEGEKKKAWRPKKKAVKEGEAPKEEPSQAAQEASSEKPVQEEAPAEEKTTEEKMEKPKEKQAEVKTGEQEAAAEEPAKNKEQPTQEQMAEKKPEEKAKE